MFNEQYDHEEYGTITVVWDSPMRTHLIAMEVDLFTPAEEIADCIRWAWDLQHDASTRGGDAVKPHSEKGIRA